jgi:hypothetical protein
VLGSNQNPWNFAKEKDGGAYELEALQAVG